MATWSHLDILKEVGDVAKFLQITRIASPNSIAAGQTGCHQMASAIIAALGNKIKALNSITAGMALEMYTAIQAAPLEDSNKAELTLAVDAVVGDAMDGLKPSTAVHATPQSLVFLYNYLTQQDWDKLCSTSCSYWDALQVVAARLRSIGVRSLKEDTKKAAVALIVHVGMDKSGSMPAYKMIYQLVQDFTKTHASCSNQHIPGVVPLATYPEHPAVSCCKQHMLRSSLLQNTCLSCSS